MRREGEAAEAIGQTGHSVERGRKVARGCSAECRCRCRVAWFTAAAKSHNDMKKWVAMGGMGMVR